MSESEGAITELRHHCDSMHAYYRSLPGSIDTKVLILTSAIAAALVFALTRVAGHEQGLIGGMQYAMYAIGSAMLVAAIGCGAISLRARMEGNANEVFSVAAVTARRNAESVVDEILALDSLDRIKQQLRHCHELACIVRIKAKWFNRCLVCGMIGLSMLLVAVFVGNA